MTDRVDADRASDREIVTSRVLNARRELVFSAFSDRQRLARWWGPRGFTNSFHEFDLRPGGAWRFVMHGPDGVDYPNRSVFIASACLPEAQRCSQNSTRLTLLRVPGSRRRPS